ncbi:ABC transporter permease [Tessaracoccus antarcticus]|uniref:Iron ABC transporter permease n=1 Tax=Tessaracoccus antarcticus TaxID=2479848 RepID=A0A3M0G649_9ACTN|nr:iron ABC transporter permease [Tessaracoccus antarcticus]RMB60028.1 iron ABC transporter permease [Tessaracoccus antarcticus]
MTDILEAPAPLEPPSVAAPVKQSRRKRVRQDPVTITLIVVVVAILFFLVLLPLGKTLSTAFSDKGLATLSKMFTSPVNRKILLNTVVLGLLVGTIGTGVGFLLAYAQARLQWRGKKFVHLLALIPIVSPPFAVATAIITLFGRGGIISKQLLGLNWNVYGLGGLTVVLALSFFPIAYLNLLGMLRSLDPALDEASESLGASKWQVFLTVTLPMLIPGFAASFLLLFVEAIADLANPIVLGGDFTVLASRAYIAIIGEYNLGAGAAYSLVLLVPALLVFIVQRYWSTRSSAVSVTGKPTGTIKLNTSNVARVPVLIAVGLVMALIITIYGTVILGGFVRILGINNEFTLDNYRYLFGGIGSDAIITTTLLALIATPIAGVMGTLIAWLVVRKLRRAAGVMDFLGMLGLAVPGTVLGIGYAIAYNSPVDGWGLRFLPALAGGGAILGGAMAIVMVYIARSIPAGLRTGIAALQQIDPAIDEASTSLGGSGLTTFRKVTIPLIRPALLAGLTYAFARSMTTISAIIFITTPQTRIMTSQILSEVEAGRFGNAFAYCTILIAIVLTVIGLLTLAVRDRPDTPMPTPGT